MSLGRWTVAALVLSSPAAGIGLDLEASEPFNPFRSPPLLAPGSGQAFGGAHCTAVPTE